MLTFEGLLEMRAKDNIQVVEEGKLVKGTAEAYMQQMLIDPVEKSLEDVKSLSQHPDTEAIIEASQAVFDFGLEVFKTDFMDIARMMDAGTPEAEIRQAIQAMFNARDQEMYLRVERLDALAIPYAKANNIPVHTR